MQAIVEKAKKLFHEKIKEFGSDPYHLLQHLTEVEKWAKLILKKYPHVDEEIIFLSVWLHDIGHYPIPTKIDHAVRSEKTAKEFLEKENYPEEKIKKVLHCIRAHRCKDVLPESFEAKILAFIDSASHMTDTMYFDIAKNNKNDGKPFRVYAKMERDFRDLSFFPEIKKQMIPLFNSWEKLLKEYEKIELK